MAHEAGKGSTQRPTNHDAFAEGHFRIWGAGKAKTTVPAPVALMPDHLDMAGESKQIQVPEGSKFLTAANEEAAPDSAA